MPHFVDRLDQLVDVDGMNVADRSNAKRVRRSDLSGINDKSPRFQSVIELVEIEVELQVTTQLQELIRSLLHVHYEKRRKEHEALEEQWQWDYKSDEFATNYLGHILHYVEGMIVEVRDRHRT